MEPLKCILPLPVRPLGHLMAKTGVVRQAEVQGHVQAEQWTDLEAKAKFGAESALAASATVKKKIKDKLSHLQ